MYSLQVATCGLSKWHAPRRLILNVVKLKKIVILMFLITSADMRVDQVTPAPWRSILNVDKINKIVILMYLLQAGTCGLSEWHPPLEGQF